MLNIIASMPLQETSIYFGICKLFEQIRFNNSVIKSEKNKEKQKTGVESLAECRRKHNA